MNDWLCIREGESWQGSETVENLPKIRILMVSNGLSMADRYLPGVKRLQNEKMGIQWRLEPRDVGERGVEVQVGHELVPSGQTHSQSHS